MKHFTLVLAFLLMGLVSNAQNMAKGTAADATTEIKQEPVKTVKKEVINADGTKTIVEEKVEEKKKETTEKSGTRMAINEKGVPTSSKPAKKEVKKEEKPSTVGSTINSKAEDNK
jgi:hypothetical protein